VPDLLTADNVRPLISGTIFTNVHHFETIASTNSAAMQSGAQGAPEGSVFVSEEQTAGKGRGGHSWHSEPRTGIYVSVLLRPEIPAAQALWFSLIAGLAAHDAITKTIGVNCDLRWPNDILIGEKKIGGILIELSSEGEHVRYVVVGMGLNVNQTSFPREIAPLATSLRIETGREWPRVELLAALLKSLDAEYTAMRQDSSAAIASVLSRFQQRSSFVRGSKVQVPENGGYTGITQGLDERGFLQVRTATGMKKVLSGGVRKI
jgi:BirA family transcriptional regulator, biotin operon repressor / biotin---[acetyl-CoA-carboxylase] ligase